MTLSALFGAVEIDLHGYDVMSALFELEAFCERAWADHEPAVKVVHGRGTGKLRDGILAWARRQRHLRVEDSPLPHETGAVMYVQLRSTV
jgi:DNA-nicking Smr family endonuclease